MWPSDSIPLLLFGFIGHSNEVTSQSPMTQSTEVNLLGYIAGWKKGEWIWETNKNYPAQKTATFTYGLFIFNDIKYWVLTPAMKAWASYLIPLSLNILIHKIVKIQSTSENSCDDLHSWNNWLRAKNSILENMRTVNSVKSTEECEQ